MATLRPMRVNVQHLALACCAMEVATAMDLDLPTNNGSLEIAENLADADLNVLVVAGTVTTAVAPNVRSAFDALPEPRRVIAYGVCAASGGPYWDSYAVVDGVGHLIPVDRIVPGCPPPPSTLVDAIVAVATEVNA